MVATSISSYASSSGHGAEQLNTDGGHDKWEETVHAVRTVYPRLG